MDMRGYQQYKEQSISTMTQAELLLLLYDELVKRLLRAELSLEQKNYDQFEKAIDRCLEIIRHLDDTLDRQYPISADLHRMYDYFCYDLSRIKFGLNLEELKRLKPMLIDLRDTFRIASKTATEEA